MKNARHSKILELIGQHSIDKQEELLAHLRRSGFEVTQATVSRDIRELGKKLNVRFHGRGGGKPAMIQGSLTGEEKTIKAYFEEIINVQ